MRRSSNPPIGSGPAGTGQEEANPAFQGPSGLASLAEDIIFRPTLEAQRLTKARFWTMVSDNPMLDPDSMGIDQLRGMLGSESIHKWWQLPGFKAWFLNKDYNRYRLESLFEQTLDAAEEILQNRDPKAQSARVNVIKILAELAGKFPSRQPTGKQEGGGLAAAIGSMDRIQLEAYLQKSGVTLQLSATGSNNPQTETITVTPEPEDSKE